MKNFWEYKIASNIIKKIERIDYLLRYKSIFGQHRWLRNLLRRTYHKLINFHGKGVTVMIGGCVETKLPPEFSSYDMEQYEKKSIIKLTTWLKVKESPLFVDIGCSLGYISCAALFSNPTVKVVAIDSDLPSLKSAERICRYTSANRLNLVYGLVYKDSTEKIGYREANVRTIEILRKLKISGNPGTHRFICIDPGLKNTKEIPTYSLDDLLSFEHKYYKEILIKCDVEGAEIFVLKGAKNVLQKLSPVLSLSVHPQYLSKYGSNKEEIKMYLKSFNYKIDLIEIDHEEHWWCENKG